MSQENITNTLIDYGLTKIEARIYVLLAKKGSLRAKDIIQYLKSSKQQIYSALKNLQSKGIVYATLEYPARFSATPFEKAIDLFFKAKMEEAKGIQDNKGALLSDWQTITMNEIEDEAAKFTVIEQRTYLYSKIQQMLQETKTEFCIVAPISDVIRTYDYVIDESTLGQQVKAKIKFRILTELNKKNINAGTVLLETAKTKGLIIRARNPELGLPLFPKMIIKDRQEIILFINQKSSNPKIFENQTALLTNCKSIVDSFQGIFNELWQNSTDINTIINRIQNGKSTIKTQVLFLPEEAQQKFEEILRAAKTEIIMMISPNTLNDFYREIFKLEEWRQKNIEIKILTPITEGSIETVQKMSKTCQIRHIAESYLETFVIDISHLFQLKTSKRVEKIKVLSRFENAFYSNDLEYIEKTKRMLENLWENAQGASISFARSGQITRQSLEKQNEATYTYSKKNSPYKTMIIKYKERPGALTEQEVLSKIAEAKKAKVKNPLSEKTVFYGRRASAVIHPPKSFKLPDMMISVSKWNQKSSFGQENEIVIELLMDVEKTKAFVPVAIVKDTIKGTELKKQIYGNTPAKNNIQVLRKDRFHIETYGNILFAAWTKPILLASSKYVLPPSCILFEGYGRIKTGLIESFPNSERIQIWEYNGMEAFVTFFHPDSKYSGPGIDGTLSREIILTSQPINNFKANNSNA